MLRALSQKAKNKKFPEPPINEDEDEDVKAERLKVKELMGCQCCEEVTCSFLLSHILSQMVDYQGTGMKKKHFLSHMNIKFILHCPLRGEFSY